MMPLGWMEIVSLVPQICEKLTSPLLLAAVIRLTVHPMKPSSETRAASTASSTCSLAASKAVEWMSVGSPLV